VGPWSRGAAVVAAGPAQTHPRSFRTRVSWSQLFVLARPDGRNQGAPPTGRERGSTNFLDGKAETSSRDAEMSQTKNLPAFARTRLSPDGSRTSARSAVGPQSSPSPPKTNPVGVSPKTNPSRVPPVGGFPNVNMQIGCSRVQIHPQRFRSVASGDKHFPASSRDPRPMISIPYGPI